MAIARFIRCPHCKLPHVVGSMACPMSGNQLDTDGEPPGDVEDDGNEELSVGELVDGKYEVIELLGRGARGRIYRARNARIERDVALKVLRNLFGGDDRMKNRFIREAQAAGRVEHGNVVNVWDVGITERGLPFIVMDLLQGDSLAERIEHQRRLPIPDVLSIGRQLLEGLGAAHRAGVVHRDVKPENVILCDAGVIKIVDFGVAGFLGGDSTQITVSGELLGTPNYLSPEQAEGGVVDERSDAWGATAVIYEMLTGEPPFARGALFETLEAVVGSPHTPPSQLRADGLPGFDVLMDRGLAKDPADRAGTVTLLEILGRIERALAEEDLRDTQRRPSVHGDAPVDQGEGT